MFGAANDRPNRLQRLRCRASKDGELLQRKKRKSSTLTTLTTKDPFQSFLVTA